MGYLGWKNHETHAAWQEILRHQDEVVPMVNQVFAQSTSSRKLRTNLEKALADWFRRRAPLQEGDLEFWGLMVALGLSQVDFDQIGLHILSEEARYSHDPYDPGVAKQDWSPRKPRWADKDWTRR